MLIGEYRFYLTFIPRFYSRIKLKRFILDDLNMNTFIHHNEGFTLLELMVVIAIIGVLAAIAIPSYMGFRYRGLDLTARKDMKSAYSAAMLYFADNPNGTLSTVDELENSGYKRSPDVEITVGGEVDNFILKSKHSGGKTLYSMDSSGTVVSTGPNSF